MFTHQEESTGNGGNGDVNIIESFNDPVLAEMEKNLIIMISSATPKQLESLAHVFEGLREKIKERREYLKSQQTPRAEA